MLKGGLNYKKYLFHQKVPHTNIDLPEASMGCDAHYHPNWRVTNKKHMAQQIMGVRFTAKMKFRNSKTKLFKV